MRAPVPPAGSSLAARFAAVRSTAVRWTAVRWTAVRWTAVRWTAVRWTVVGWTAVAVLALAGCSFTPPQPQPSRSPEANVFASASASASPSAAAPGGAGAAATGRWPDVADRTGPSVVTVIAGPVTASGVVYEAAGSIVTAAHVVGTAKRVELIYADGAHGSGSVTAVDRLAGLALIRSERSGLLPVTPATGLPPPGSEVLAVGGPGSPLIRALLGGFAPPRKSTTRAAGDVLLLDAAIPVTASGSAVLDSDGHLVAIAEAELAGPGLAIPVQTVTAVVPRLLAADDTPLADLGIRPAPVTRQVSQLLQLGASEGVLAQDVTAGGAAAKAGIRRGDVVTELGGERIATVSDYLRLVAAALPARPIPVTVSRSGETQELTVTPAALKR